MGVFLENERYTGLKRDKDGSITWNGHTWPLEYQSTRYEGTDGHPYQSVRGSAVFLTCAHWVGRDDRFCPMCGRLIVGTNPATRSLATTKSLASSNK